MSETKRIVIDNMTTGDAAVEGLFGGLIAGIVMAVYLALAGLTFGEGPLEILSRFGGSEGSTPLVGLLLHLGVSGVYGVLFALLCHLTARPWGFNPARWSVGLIGATYGLILWLLAQWVLLPSTNSPLMGLPGGHFSLAHLLFGAALGLLTNLGNE